MFFYEKNCRTSGLASESLQIQKLWSPPLDFMGKKACFYLCHCSKIDLTLEPFRSQTGNPTIFFIKNHLISNNFSMIFVKTIFIKNEEKGLKTNISEKQFFLDTL